MYIAISGNIGSGKTTLTQLLAQHYNWQARFEAVDYNPYLEDYYGNIPRRSSKVSIFSPPATTSRGPSRRATTRPISTFSNR